MKLYFLLHLYNKNLDFYEDSKFCKTSEIQSYNKSGNEKRNILVRRQRRLTNNNEYLITRDGSSSNIIFSPKKQVSRKPSVASVVSRRPSSRKFDIYLTFKSDFVYPRSCDSKILLYLHHFFMNFRRA